MSVIGENSCRICFSPNSALVNVFGLFHKRSVEQIVLSVCNVQLNRNKNLPQFLCELCMSRLLLAETIKILCQKNEKFLAELSEISSDIKVESSNEHQEEDLIRLSGTEDDVIDETEVLLHLEPPNESIEWESLVQINDSSKAKFKSTKKSFFCTHCFREFNTRAKCVYHEKAKHEPKKTSNDERPFTCDRCGMMFKHKSHMINHLNVVHLRIKRYQCNICGFAMYSKTHHKNHVKSHSNIKDFKCGQCGKDFGRKESLAVHLRTHSNERPYSCKVCHQSYTAHTDLKRHMFTHTQVHPYVCKLCKKGFFLKRLLCDHVNSVHIGIDTTSWLSGKTFHNF